MSRPYQTLSESQLAEKLRDAMVTESQRLRTLRLQHALARMDALKDRPMLSAMPSQATFGRRAAG